MLQLEITKLSPSHKGLNDSLKQARSRMLETNVPMTGKPEDMPVKPKMFSARGGGSMLLSPNMSKLEL
jgi:hypothetical protein